MTGCLFDKVFTSLEFPIETLMQDIKPVKTEKNEPQDESLLFTLF